MNSVNEWINKNVVYPYKGILEYKKEWGYKTYHNTQISGKQYAKYISHKRPYIGWFN
jgi:hypothetical protein